MLIFISFIINISLYGISNVRTFYCDKHRLESPQLSDILVFLFGESESTLVLFQLSVKCFNLINQGTDQILLF